MTESRDGVDPPFSKLAVQRTIAAVGLLVCLWQILSLTRLTLVSREHGEDMEPHRRWGELSGQGHPLIQIDINQAGIDELSLLPRVGPILARRIVENRERLGPFESLDALSRVDGIGDKTIQQLCLLADVDREPSRDGGEQAIRGKQVELRK